MMRVKIVIVTRDLNHRSQVVVVVKRMKDMLPNQEVVVPLVVMMMERKMV